MTIALTIQCNVLCFKCNKVGYIFRDCPKRTLLIDDEALFYELEFELKDELENLIDSTNYFGENEP